MECRNKVSPLDILLGLGVVAACTKLDIRLLLLRQDRHFKNVFPVTETALDDWSQDTERLRDLLNSTKSAEVMSEDDPYKEFCDEHLVRKQDSYVQWSDLLEEFRKWHHAYFGKELATGHAAKEIQAVKSYFKKKLDTEMKQRTQKGKTLNAGAFNWMQSDEKRKTYANLIGSKGSLINEAIIRVLKMPFSRLQDIYILSTYTLEQNSMVRFVQEPFAD